MLMSLMSIAVAIRRSKSVLDWNLMQYLFDSFNLSDISTIYVCHLLSVNNFGRIFLAFFGWLCFPDILSVHYIENKRVVIILKPNQKKEKRKKKLVIICSNRTRFFYIYKNEQESLTDYIENTIRQEIVPFVYQTLILKKHLNFLGLLLTLKMELKNLFFIKMFILEKKCV